MKNVKFLFRALAFVLVLTITIIEINNVLTPKKYFDNEWPTTSTYKGFYQMEENSIDVLFLGSSHAAACFNPQKIYNDYGIRSYNLGCEQQNLLVSYYWLKEALQYQKPKTVILDLYMLFEYDPTEPLNTTEPCTRMAMDAMKWSKVKYEAVKAICANDETQSFNSYLFKNIRFHTRWTNLTEQDFTFRALEKHCELKGYAPLATRGVNVNLNYQPMAGYDESIIGNPMPLMNDYLNQIKMLCSENNIKLVLVKTPGRWWFPERHNYALKYAQDNNLDFVDFNLVETYNACGFEYTQDMADDDHCNIWGAEKVSSYLAQLFMEPSVPNETMDVQWTSTNDYYQKIMGDCQVRNITNLNEYIDAIDQDRYTILVSTRYDMDFCMDDDVINAFAKLGLDINHEPCTSYYAALADSYGTQLSSREALKYTGSTRNKMQEFTITSGGYIAGAQSSIKLGNVEYSKDCNGINIVVYNEETRKVIDSAVFDGELHR